MGTSLAGYQIVSRPNNSLTASQRVRLLLLLAAIPLIVAIGFILVGMWMIFPFFGLELAALVYAFYYVNCHAMDYESITVDDGRLVVERRDNKHTSQAVLNPYWTQVIMQSEIDGGLHLYLRSYGKDIEVGRYMDAEQKAVLAGQLRKRTGTLQGTRADNYF